MPWVDIIIVVFIAIMALIGYNVGLLGALTGFISKIIGLIAAWILTPIAQAWLETKWGIESIFTRLIHGRLPAVLKDLVTEAAGTAQTLQGFREKLYESLSPELALYLQRTVEKSSGGQTIPPPEAVINAISREIAQSLIWALLFVFSWLMLSILINGFLSIIFIGDDGTTILGVIDGVLGTVAMTIITVTALIVLSGIIYPVALMAGASGSMAKFYPYLMASKLTSWMASIYQMYLLPLMG